MKKPPAVPIFLTFRFMILLASAMLSLSLLFVFALRFSVSKRQDNDLQKSLLKIKQSLQTMESDSIEETNLLDFLELPYYITYNVYKADSKQVIYSNDSLLPVLDSQGKCETYFEKNYFTDSDLNLRYFTQDFLYNSQNLVIEVAIDIANDSAAKMLFLLPKLALFSISPILLISLALSLLISRKTISAFRQLQEDYDREKAFTSNVSHELKTPIAIIDGHANLIKRWGKDDPKQLMQSIEAILKETSNMTGIVSTLLDLSRVENGKVKIEKEKFSVKDLFLKLQHGFKITHPDCKIHILAEDFFEIESDRQKLHQILTVILSNSVKFAGENCEIKLTAQKSGGKAELRIEDNGPGFEPEILPHVFERFFKGDASHNRNIRGAGLGLSIAKTLTEILGGSIEAKNAPDGGALLIIKL